MDRWEGDRGSYAVRVGAPGKPGHHNRWAGHPGQAAQNLGGVGSQQGNHERPPWREVMFGEGSQHCSNAQVRPALC